MECAAADPALAAGTVPAGDRILASTSVSPEGAVPPSSGRVVNRRRVSPWRPSRARVWPPPEQSQTWVSALVSSSPRRVRRSSVEPGGSVRHSSNRMRLPASRSMKKSNCDPAGIAMTPSSACAGVRSTGPRVISDHATPSSRWSVDPSTTADGASTRPYSITSRLRPMIWAVAGRSME